MPELPEHHGGGIRPEFADSCLWQLGCNSPRMQIKLSLLVIGVIAAVALAAAGRIRRWLPRIAVAARGMIQERDDERQPECKANGATPDLNQLLRQTLRWDLSLAAEHVHSIRWLLEISRQHEQPIPRAALTNLELVSKHLGEMQRRIEIAGEETPPESNIIAFAHRPETQPPLPPRPRQSSFGYHASPSDRSRLSD